MDTTHKDADKIEEKSEKEEELENHASKDEREDEENEEELERREKQNGYEIKHALCRLCDGQWCNFKLLKCEEVIM